MSMLMMLKLPIAVLCLSIACSALHRRLQATARAALLKGELEPRAQYAAVVMPQTV
jgi:hypothetical protein